MTALLLLLLSSFSPTSSKESNTYRLAGNNIRCSTTSFPQPWSLLLEQKYLVPPVNGCLLAY
jgi:hypothetical protein